MLAFQSATTCFSPSSQHGQMRQREPTKLVDTILVSLSSLINYGVQEDRRLVQKMVAHLAFKNYEKGLVDRAQFVEIISAKFKLTSQEVHDMLNSLVKKCEVNSELLNLCSNNGKTLIGWQDIPEVEMCAIKQNLVIAHGLRRLKAITRNPDIALMKSKGGCVVFDKVPEVASVHRAMGWNAIPFDASKISSNVGYLKTLNPKASFSKGWKALANIVSEFQLRSVIEMDQPQKPAILPGQSGEDLCLRVAIDVGQVEEYFNPILCAMCYGDILPPSLKSKMARFINQGPFGYFGDEFHRLPADIDVMSVNIATLLELDIIDLDSANKAFDHVLGNADSDGVLQVYFDADRPRVDHVVLCNMLYAAYTLGREEGVRFNEKLVHGFFLNNGHIFGTKYYHRPESFLFHFGRILYKFGSRVPNYQQLVDHMRVTLRSRFGHRTSALDVGKRLILSNYFQISNPADGPLLLSMQNEDGSWDATSLYLLPTTKGKVLNPAVDMCFALKGLGLAYINLSLC